jgi:hypothetical protein
VAIFFVVAKWVGGKLTVSFVTFLILTNEVKVVIPILENRECTPRASEFGEFIVSPVVTPKLTSRLSLLIPGVVVQYHWLVIFVIIYLAVSLHVFVFAGQVEKNFSVVKVRKFIKFVGICSVFQGLFALDFMSFRINDAP